MDLSPPCYRQLPGGLNDNMSNSPNTGRSSRRSSPPRKTAIGDKRNNGWNRQEPRISLPPLRDILPELTPRGEPDRVSDRNQYSPPSGQGVLVSPTDYVPSPSYKRRRLSDPEEEESKSRDRSIPRRFNNSPTRPSQAHSPSSSAWQHQGDSLSTTESWSGSGRNSPHTASRGLPSIRSPPPFDSGTIHRQEWRPNLPALSALPILTVDRSASSIPRGRSGGNEYALDSSSPGARTYPQLLASAYDPPPATSSYHHPAFPSYGYEQPRGKSYSGPSGTPIPHDRTPFSNSHQAMLYQESGYPYRMSGMNDLGNDGKQRKRRGNLPKETTDKLRAWFVNHLQHPYPTEDEKQELMKQTGLQINQISNWFINARRRQLPALVNNARAEVDARTARESDGNSLGESPIDYGDERTRGSIGSEGDSEGDFGSRGRHPMQGRPKRESI